MLPKDYGVQIGDPGTKMGMTELDITALKKLYSCDSKVTGNDVDDENNENKDPNGNDFGDKFGDNYGDDNNNIGGNFGDINGDINGNDNIGTGGNLPMPPKPLPIPSGFGKININNIHNKIRQNKRPNKHQDKLQDKHQDKALDKLRDQLKEKLQDKLHEKLPNKPQDESDKSILPMPQMPSLNYEKEKGHNNLKLNELTGDYGTLGNMIDFSKFFGSFLKKK